MKKSFVLKVLLVAAFVFLLGYKNDVQADSEVSFNTDNYSITIMHRPGEGDFYNRSSIEVVHHPERGNYLLIHGGHYSGELCHFDVGIVNWDEEIGDRGNESFFSYTSSSQTSLMVYGYQLDEAFLEPGRYFMSLAIKTFGEDASIDDYDVYVSYKTNDDSDFNAGQGTGTGSDDAEEVVVKSPGKVKIQSLKRTSSKKAKLTWKKVTGSGIRYKITYSTSKKFTKKTTLSTTTKQKSLVLKKLKNKKYYVKVQAFKKVDGKNVYGKESAVKTLSKWKK